MKITYIGHATTLIEWDGLRILTDPLFSPRVLFFKRKVPLNFDPTKLSKLDAILISHAHCDHLDLSSFKYIPSDVLVVVPEGLSKAISPFINNPILELATWGRYTIKDLEICALPAKHIGGRFFPNPFSYSKCHGYMMSRLGKSIYFAGDTAYLREFKDLNALFPIYLALLPIAIHSHNWIMRPCHMNIEDCLQAWQDLGRPDWIPIHWGTFFQSFHDTHYIIHALKTKAEQDSLLKEKLHLLGHGESQTFMTSVLPKLEGV